MNNLVNAMNKLQESKSLNEAKFPNSLPKFIYDLDKDCGNAWSANEPSKIGDGANWTDVVEVERNGKSTNSLEDIINAVLKKYPQLEVHTKSKYDDSVLFKKKNKEVKTESIDSLATIESIITKLRESFELAETLYSDESNFEHNELATLIGNALDKAREINDK